MGYLECEKCGGYYELQEGESADNFDLCECGGKLKYVKSLETPQEETNETTESINCPHCGKGNPSHSQYCQDCGKEITAVNTANNEIEVERSTLLIVVGYIFAIFGFLLAFIGVFVGLIIGIILIRRGGPNKIHGLIITALSSILIFFGLAIAALLIYRAYFMGI